MKLHLRDTNPAVVAAWREVFAGTADVTVSHGNILELTGTAIVSPANSFGWMDGGIDLAYRERFGERLERAVQREIETYHAGELPVGQAIMVHVGDQRIQTIVVAPTMRVPEPVRGTVNAYLAFRAALTAFRALERQMRESCLLLCPGLCTLTGRMPPLQAAIQMRHAWHVVVERHAPIEAAVQMAAHRDMLVPR